VTDWIGDLIAKGGYFGVALLMFIETVFPPIPSEVIMPLAGIEAARGPMNIWGVILSGTSGAMAGNTLWYCVARALGIDRFQPFVRKYGRWLTVTWKDLKRADKWFDRKGWLFVLFGRMTPSLRSLVSVPAGLFEMRLRTFLIASTIGTFAWTALLAFLGQIMGENYEAVGHYMGPVSTGILGLMFGYYLFRVIRWRAEH
jgi:membrane protein DedA with SNARE-associated domain